MSHTPPKGSLEDLFRHHLLESEAAAVPPRPQAWDQLENSLLLAQNEKYRRRLLLHRWAMAASLLLAAMATGGWWHSQQAQQPGLAQATRVALPAAGRSAGLPGRATGAGTAAQMPGSDAAAADGLGASSMPASPANSLAIAQPATSSSATPVAVALATPGFAAARHRTATNSVAAHRRHYRAASGGATAGLGLAAIAPDAARHQVLAGASRDAENPESGAQEAALAFDEQLPAAAAPLAARLAQLALPAGAALPTPLPGVELPAPAAAPAGRSWQFGLAYASSFFQPNIDFAKDAGDYNAALGGNSADRTLAAAAEYREHLRGGLSQRLSWWAGRRLGGSRFSLRTGLEVSQSNAQSASTVAFVGEQVPDMAYLRPQPAAAFRTTTFRYRAASVPVEVSYHGASRPGFSLYAKLGGVLSTLFNVRSEVEGNPEAARTYTLSSANSPYRPVSASVRGGLGVRYQPASHYWSLNLGPVADVGVLSLNNDPVQSFWQQQRPYSVGLEAGLELGRAPKMP